MLRGKVALVTGAARGIGLATSRLMLQHGAKVSLADVNEKLGVTACTRLRREFGEDATIFMPVDVTNSVQLRELFLATVKVFGKIDIVCNNAGIADEENWKKMIAVNLVAMMEGTHLAIEFMSQRLGGKGGVVINVSSMGGIFPMPFAPNYSASKSGVVGFTRSMTEVLMHDGVRVNCICPQFTNTEMLTQTKHKITPKHGKLLNRMGLLQCDTVAEAILELVNENSKTGAIMMVTLKRGTELYIPHKL